MRDRSQTLKKESRTTLIIGAGASTDFSRATKKDDDEKEENKINLPTGEELVRKMINFGNEIPKYFLYGYLRKNLLKNNNLSNPNSSELLSILSRMLFYVSSDILHSSNNGQITINNYYINQLKQRDSDNVLNRDLHDHVQLFCESLIKSEIVKTTNPNHSTSNPSLVLEKDQKKLAELIIHELLDLEPYYNLSKLLREYDPPSIDNFLSQIENEKVDITTIIKGFEDTKEERGKLIVAGKELIAFYLFRSEDSKIFNSENRIWYRWLRNAIMNCGSSSDEIEKNLQRLSLICFNYDRSLDFFLQEKLRPNLYQALKKRIIYPYGSLSESESNKYIYGFLKNLSTHEPNDLCEISNLFLTKNSFLKEAAKKIKVIGESEREDDDIKNKFTKASQVLRNSANLYLLGFGFLQENCSKLNFLEIPRVNSINIIGSNALVNHFVLNLR
ncbi:MAG: hypothetical protein EBS06_03580 [Proteobacteria bacterium]|nr:hypothetical protein [Pseudomonadota bacterium]